MTRLLYRLWNSNSVVGSWTDIHDAAVETLDYLMANPDEIDNMSFTYYKTSRATGSRPVLRIHGQEILEHMKAIADYPEGFGEEEQDEW